jgi:hypothetical protein
VIDDDLGRSAAGGVQRAGFDLRTGHRRRGAEAFGSPVSLPVRKSKRVLADRPGLASRRWRGPRSARKHRRRPADSPQDADPDAMVLSAFPCARKARISPIAGRAGLRPDPSLPRLNLTCGVRTASIRAPTSRLFRFARRSSNSKAALTLLAVEPQQIIPG